MSRMMLPGEVGPTSLTEGEIRAWRHGRAHGERAGIERAARRAEEWERHLITGMLIEPQIRALATAIRALKVEGE